MGARGGGLEEGRGEWQSGLAVTCGTDTASRSCCACLQGERQRERQDLMTLDAHCQRVWHAARASEGCQVVNYSVTIFSLQLDA